MKRRGKRRGWDITEEDRSKQKGETAEGVGECICKEEKSTKRDTHKRVYAFGSRGKDGEKRKKGKTKV